MKYTLLEMVQRILESMTSDQVNSITDTDESTQVANIIKECYYQLVGDLELAENETLFNLTASGDSEKPCLMTLPEGVLRIDWIKYNRGSVADPDYVPVQFFPVDTFIEMTSSLDTDNSNVGTQEVSFGDTDFVQKFNTDRVPSRYTSPDDSTLLFDAYDEDEDSTLVSSKTLCLGLVAPTFTLDDSFTPELDARFFNLLINTARAQAFIEMKQVANPKAEERARKGKITAQRTAETVNDLSDYQKHTLKHGRGRR